MNPLTVSSIFAAVLGTSLLTVDAFIPASLSAKLSMQNAFPQSLPFPGKPPATPEFCWPMFHERKVVSMNNDGGAMVHCPEGAERQGSSCFERCAEGFIGLGPYCLPDRRGGEAAAQITLAPLSKHVRRRAQVEAVEVSCEKDGSCYESCPGAMKT